MAAAKPAQKSLSFLLGVDDITDIFTFSFDTTAGLLTASAGESAKSCPSNLLPRSTSVTPKSEERGNQEMSDMLSRMSSIRSLDKESKSELRDDLKRFHSSILKHTPDSVESGKLLADLTAINCHRLKDIERSK